MRSMQIESVLQIKNRSEPAKNRFSVALNQTVHSFHFSSGMHAPEIFILHTSANFEK